MQVKSISEVRLVHRKLLDTAKNLRKIHWTIQKNEGIDFIPSNDFSFYDIA